MSTNKFNKPRIRLPDSIRKGYPDPPDARFETLEGNLEINSKFKNSKGSVNLNFAKRPDIWGGDLVLAPYIG